MTNTQATLLERLRDGADALAWDEFFARYWPTIYGFSRHRGCSQHTAEEIVQDVMLKVFQQRDVYQYDPARGRFRDWLGTVVRNKIAEHHRRPGRRSPMRLAGLEMGEETETVGVVAEERAVFPHHQRVHGTNALRRAADLIDQAERPLLMRQRDVAAAKAEARQGADRPRQVTRSNVSNREPFLVSLNVIIGTVVLVSDREHLPLQLLPW